MWSCLNQIHDPRADSSPGGKAAAAQCQGKVPKGKAVCRVIPDGTSQLAGGSCQLLFGKQEDREQLSEGPAHVRGNCRGNGSPGQEAAAQQLLVLLSCCCVSVTDCSFSERKSWDAVWEKSCLGRGGKAQQGQALGRLTLGTGRSFFIMMRRALSCPAPALPSLHSRRSPVFPLAHGGADRAREIHPREE